ncbi:MAG: hypothetical protein CHACPFDD_03900 [Phycisphaerae bacterium]|nr:hypothetical protein [Phycisphaerae bacterium]
MLRQFSQRWTMGRVWLWQWVGMVGTALLGAPTVSAFQELYYVTDLGAQGAETARDINEFGVVVGTILGSHAYAYFDLDGDLVADAGELIDLGALPGQYDRSDAYGVSSTGQIAGWSRSDADVNHAIKWSGGLIDLGPDEVEDFDPHYATAINASGIAVGRWGSGPWPALWTSGGTRVDLWDPVGNTGGANDINDTSQVVGWRNYAGQSGRFAFLWKGGSTTNLGQLGGAVQWAEATAISSFGFIVGWSNTAGGETHAFLRVPHGANSSAGTMIDLGTLGGNYSAAYGVNDRGQVVGVARNQFDQDRAFVYTNGQMYDLNTLISPNATMEIPYAINNQGQIVGLGHMTGQNQTGLLLTPNDADGDGLFDVWESQGGGIDFNSDGTIDLDLYALGARPDHKDLFLEIDAMVDRAPAAAAINLVVAAFDAAPVNNPDGIQGIKLRAQVDETDIPRVPWNAMIDIDGDTVGDWPAGFDPTKAARFGTAAQRAHASSANILGAKRWAYRYCIFADTFAGSDWSGLAELPGNDFIVTLGGWTTPGGTPLQQAGTLMHELGHTLGLRHGGGDDINHKPNYYSVMNYTFQTPKGWFPGWRPVYSRSVLPTLNEDELNELAGLSGSAAVPVEIGPLPSQIVRMSGAVDFNRNGVATDGIALADLNRVRANHAASPGQILRGFNDWPALIYGVTGNGDFAEGEHSSAIGLEELTAAEHEASDATEFACDPCDVNCDGTVNGFDIDPFVELLTSAATPCESCAGDVNGDGTVDGFDIDALVECLIGA